MSDSPSVIFVLDTNILEFWRQSFASDNPSDITQRVSSFCQNTPYPVIVPDIVWLEMVALTVQKNIPMGDDFNNTLRNFRDRQTYVQQLEQMIRNRSWTLGWQPKENASLFKRATEIMQDQNLLDPVLFRWMQNRAKKQYKNDAPKLLDGLDSAILLYLHAVGCIFPESRVILYTADRPLSIIAEKAHLKYSWFAKNTGAVFAVFPAIRCRSCRHDNPVSVLNDPYMQCRNPDRAAHVLKI